tara:strand:- start:998 stop:1384 length:387 start_codon:yes stop_codon:yes gene_type:complete
MIKIEQIERACAFIKLKELHNVEELDFSVGYDTITVTVDYKSINEDELRSFKRIFGPFESTDEYGGKALEGRVSLEEGFYIKCRLTRYLACNQMNKEEVSKMTEADRDAFWEHARAGNVKVYQCEETV